MCTAMVSRPTVAARCSTAKPPASRCGGPPGGSCSFFADDIATHLDGDGQVSEHASRVPSGPRIFVGLPARLWIRLPVSARPDHRMRPAHELAMLSKECSEQHTRIYSRRRVRVCCSLHSTCRVLTGPRPL